MTISRTDPFLGMWPDGLTPVDHDHLWAENIFGNNTPPLPIANDVWLSFKDRFGFKPRLNEASAFQTDPRLAEATAAAVKYFEKEIQKHLCASPTAQVDISQLRYSIFPKSQGSAPANSSPMRMSFWESSFTIGWYEYRLDFFRSDTTFRNRISWRANVVVIDKLGWEEKYKSAFQELYYQRAGGWFYDSDYFQSYSRRRPALRQLPDKLMHDEAQKFANGVNFIPAMMFGPTREFERARWTIFGEACCGNENN